MSFSFPLLYLCQRLIELSTASFQSIQPRHIFRILLQKDNRSTFICQTKQFLQYIGRHQAGTGNYQRFIRDTTGSQYLAVLTHGITDEVIRNIVHIISRTINTMHRLYKTGSTLCHLMNIEKQQTPVLFIPHIVYRQINQEVIIRLSHLQETLATGDIIEKCRGIPPNIIRRTHINGSIELPTRPGSLSGRVSGSMKIHVIHTRDKHQVHIGFALRK